MERLMISPTYAVATVVALLLAFSAPEGVAVATPPAEVLPLDCETALALSAAPTHLRADAGVYALTPDGYVLERQGANGFTCIVNRDHPRVLKPTCFDQEGTATIVPKIVFVGGRIMEGHPVEHINADVAARFESGDFQSPRRPGLAYMLSRYNRPYNATADALGWFPPHLMFYGPDLTSSDIGFNMEAWHDNASLPFVGYQGPHGYMIVMTDDGTERARSDLPASCPAWVFEG